MNRRGVALVIERDPDMRDTMACWLADEWEVAMARNCAHALNDYSPVDVLVVCGEDEADISAVLAQFAERGYAGPAVTVAATDCTPTVAGIGVTPLRKPVTREELVPAVEQAYLSDAGSTRDSPAVE